MLYLSYADLKSFWLSNQSIVPLNYIELNNKYILWVNCKKLVIICNDLFKGSDECSDFEGSYKALANINEADRTRITTNKIGAKLTFHYACFTTSDLDSVDNLDYNGDDPGSITIKLYDANGDEITNPANEGNAVKTIIDFTPNYSYEAAGGELQIPDVLDGNEELFKAHVILLPGVLDHEYVHNCHLKHMKGKTIDMDAALNPAELQNGYNTIRMIFEHSAGAQTNFQVKYSYFVQ